MKHERNVSKKTALSLDVQLSATLYLAERSRLLFDAAHSRLNLFLRSAISPSDLLVLRIQDVVQPLVEVAIRGKADIISYGTTTQHCRHGLEHHKCC